MITSETTVREVAVKMPESTRIFEKFKIDYCCGGNQSLTTACAAAGIDVHQVMKMLGVVTESKSQEAADFRYASVARLVEHIVNTHHVFTKSEMDRLEALTEKVSKAHGENHPELDQLREMFRALCMDLKPHMFKEEQVLFPYLIAMTQAAEQNRPGPFAPFGTVNNPVRMMMKEHDAAGQLLCELRALTSDYTVPPDACISYQTLFAALENFEKDLHQHIHLENNILFPKALELERALNRSYA